MNPNTRSVMSSIMKCITIAITVATVVANTLLDKKKNPLDYES